MYLGKLYKEVHSMVFKDLKGKIHIDESGMLNTTKKPATASKKTTKKPTKTNKK